MSVDPGSAPWPAEAGATSQASTRQESALLHRRLSAFAWEFVRTTRPGSLVASGVLVVLSAVTEGVSLLLLIPLVQLVGDSQGQRGWIEAHIGGLLETIGLSLS